MEVKLDTLSEHFRQHNEVISSAYQLEQDMAVTRKDIETLYRKVNKRWQISWRTMNGGGDWRAIIQSVLGVLVTNTSLIVGFAMLNPNAGAHHRVRDGGSVAYHTEIGAQLYGGEPIDSLKGE